MNQQPPEYDLEKAREENAKAFSEADLDKLARILSANLRKNVLEDLRKYGKDKI